MNNSKQAILDYMQAQKETGTAQEKAADAAQNFIESLMGDTKEESEAMFEILKHRLDRSYNIFKAHLKYAEEKEKYEDKVKAAHVEARKSFFGRAYDKFFGKEL